MKKNKKLLKGLALPFALAGICCFGGLFASNNVDLNTKITSADFSVHQTLKNDVPDYLIMEADENLSYANDNLFLFQGEQSFSLSIANNEEDVIDNTIDTSAPKKNYAYIPDNKNKQIFYYFDFQSTLSLYHNLSVNDIKQGLTSENLIKNQSISNYASFDSTTAFVPDGYSFTPQQFNIQFELNLLNTEIKFGKEVEGEIDNSIVTLNQEGCYTLVIPVVEYYTTNGGASFSAKEQTIYYSFMAFNSNTYFDSTTGKPKLSPSENLHQALLGSSSSEFSTYYYYNYAYGLNDAENSLPQITFNPQHYQLKIGYTDIDLQTKTVYVEYQNEKVVQLDESGKEIPSQEEIIKIRQNSNGTATIIFYDLGTYDLAISYLYSVSNGQTTITYDLPFENLKNNDIFQNKSQRLYIFGYQTVYSDYSNINPQTNQPESVDLKVYDFENAKYQNAADITSTVNKLMGTTTLANSNPHILDGDGETLATNIKNLIDRKEIQPVSTNQTPIKFLTNANNSAVHSKIYTRTEKFNDAGDKEVVWAEKGSFQGFNENNSGTYLYIIQYTYDDYMSINGTLQSAYYHYQVFYFTVTNNSPTVDVLEMSDTYGEVYTNGFTNKSVYILNNSENNNYDADVTITLSARNYLNNTYYFTDTNIKNLSKYGLSYQKFEFNPDQTKDSEYNSKIANKYGILIENTSPIANAEFTIKIATVSMNPDKPNKPSVRKFTIDTYEIGNIQTRNAAVQTSTSYKITYGFDGYATNNPFIVSWDEKASGALTYAYMKYIPMSAINYYTSLNQDNLAELLARLIDSHDTLPVSYKIDLKNAENSTWSEYKNSQEYTTRVPSTYVKSNDGFYIFEVYDQAGNVSFEIFLLDSSSPIFIQEISGDTTIQKILTNSESLTVPENNIDITIKWTENKAIYLDNMTSDVLDTITAYPYGINVNAANDLLKEKIAAFFTTSNENIEYFNDITADITDETSDSGLVPTGISSFNGNYLIIPIKERVYIKEGTSSTFAPFNTSSYEIEFFDEKGNLIADNTTYKFLLRDSSNTSDTGNEELNYKNYPSGYVSFNVTSDASKLMIKTVDGELLDFSSYSMSGSLFSYKEDGKTIYTHIPNDKKEGEEGYKEYTETSLGYKFSYYTPTNNKKELVISYIPVAANGSKLQNITLKYYPYVLASASDPSVNTNHYFYYTISEEVAKTVNIFTASDKTYDQGEIETFELALGTDTYPLAGRYIIERTYMDDSTTDKYDYFRRTLTITIDNFNLISPLESVTNGTDSTLESVVGGEIVLSMYSGSNNSAIEVSFPTYKENGLSSGSFYTKDSFTDIDENLSSYSIEGNKLPMSIYIPKYKYTVANYDSVTDSNGITYLVDKNDALSYYGDAYYIYNNESGLYEVYVENVLVGSYGTERDALTYLNNFAAIVEYQIFAEIKATVIENNKEVTKYYYSDGTETNGYLNFYQASSKDGAIDKSKKVDNFYLKGDYVVTLYQANNIGATSSFYTFYKFGFKIKSQAPEFDVIGSNGYQLTNTNTPNIYYTNSSELKVQWEVPTNEYEAKIDESKITIKSFPSSATIYTSEIVDNITTKYFTINTASLVRASSQYSYIEITMQYEGHNSLYYSTITKRIYFDKTAPTQNLQSLMTLTENATDKAFTTNYQLMFMRKYADNNGNDMALTSIEALSDVSYNYSLDTGYFKYFSYNVTTDFFNSILSQTVANAPTNAYDTQFVYYKAIDNIETYTQVDNASFSAGSYYYISSTEAARLYCGYYEIVEMDYAGNMTVYLVYLTNSTEEDDSNVRTDALSYSNSKTIEDIVIDDSQIVDGFNIYSTSKFELKSLNYKSDPWELITVQLSNKAAKRYLRSPWLNESQIYQITFTDTGIAFDQVSLKSIFEDVDSSSAKHNITFTDRILGTKHIVYLSIMDASLSPEKVVDPTKSSAILNIQVPTLAQVQSTTTSYVYPTNIAIYQYNTSVIGEENWQEIMNANQLTYGTWTPTEEFVTALDYIFFTTLADGKTLQIVINLGANATQKVKYVITDNFGNVSTIIQLANEVEYREISGSSIIYTDYESDGSISYLTDGLVNYSYNVLLYSIEIYDRDGLDISDIVAQNPNPLTNITVVTFTPSKDYYYDDYYKIIVRDIEAESDEPVKTIHIRLYNKLPYRTTSPNEVANGGIIFNDKNQQPIEESNIGTIPNKTVNFNGQYYTSSCDVITTYSQNVTVRFKNGQDLAFEGGFSYLNGYSYSVYISNDNGLTWENINSANSDTSGYTISGVGDYLILVKYDSDRYFTNLCKIFTVSILDSSASYYYITVDGLAVKKSDVKYLSLDNREYDVNYIVSVDYADKDNRLTITENEELNVVVTRMGIDNTGSLVTVEIYHYECDESIGDFTIIYIAETNNIVNTLTYETASGSTTSIKDLSSEIVVANNETEPNFNKLKINFSSYYGISANKINVEVLKLFNGIYTEIECEIYENGENAYIYLERAGSYRLKIYDSCSPANVQAFKNSQYFEIIFLSHVPFLVTQKVGDVEIVTEPIQRAVYNGAVSIKPTNLSTYYQTSGYPTITVLLNGHEYNNYEVKNRVYTFTTPGYYTVKFSAKSTTGIVVREEEFNFTIINPNESREAYEFTQFNKYYIEQVIKDGVDITADLLSMANFETINVNGQKYLATLSISYLDNKTGEGRYKIVINHNKQNLSSIIGKNFAFEFWINHVSTLPINVSTSKGNLNEGDKTSKDVIISFNVKNLYKAVGDCYIKIGNDLTKYYTAENLSEYGETDSIKIVKSGTYFIQLYTTGGKLLYSFKVVKTEPLNFFAVFAIVIGVVVFLVVIFITIKLRKRQKVK